MSSFDPRKNPVRKVHATLRALGQRKQKQRTVWTVTPGQPQCGVRKQAGFQPAHTVVWRCLCTGQVETIVPLLRAPSPQSTAGLRAGAQAKVHWKKWTVGIKEHSLAESNCYLWLFTNLFSLRPGSHALRSSQAQHKPLPWFRSLNSLRRLFTVF